MISKILQVVLLVCAVGCSHPGESFWKYHGGQMVTTKLDRRTGQIVGQVYEPFADTRLPRYIVKFLAPPPPKQANSPTATASASVFGGHNKHAPRRASTYVREELAEYEITAVSRRGDMSTSRLKKGRK